MSDETLDKNNSQAFKEAENVINMRSNIKNIIDDEIGIRRIDIEERLAVLKFKAIFIKLLTIWF